MSWKVLPRLFKCPNKTSSSRLDNYVLPFPFSVEENLWFVGLAEISSLKCILWTTWSLYNKLCVVSKVIFMYINDILSVDALSSIV